MSKNDRIENRGICGKCKGAVPAFHKEIAGKIFLIKECPKCGTTEALVSSDAKRWREKREMCDYKSEAESTCSLKCVDCNHGKSPMLVFLDVTNRCNMNCPICLANITAMGFRFEPPMAYFDNVFKSLSQRKPKPKIQLFGGEPTVRDDLIDIINLAKSYGLSARVVTNGIRMADEEYCKKLLATGTQLMFAFDGRDPEIYRKIRNTPEACQKKLKGLENVRKYRKAKITIMCCTGLKVNEHSIGDLIEFCHEGRDYIAAIDFIPLTETWGPDEVDAGDTTIEDVEHIVANALPGTEFVPAGMLYKFKTLLENFDVGRLTFGGAHPNCESVAILISDGKAYHPASRYLKKSFSQMVQDAVTLDKELGIKLNKSILVKIFGKPAKKFLFGLSAFGFFKKNAKMGEVFGERVWTNIMKILWGLLRGEKAKNLLRRYTQCHGILRMIILPFEESMCLESARLVECPGSFAYEHPLTGEIRLMPVCAWPIFKDDILKETSKRYGVQAIPGSGHLNAVNK